MNCLRRHTCWQNKRLYWEGVPRQTAVGSGNQEDCSAMWLTVGFYGDGINFRVVFGQWFWHRLLPGGTPIAQPRWMPVKRILGDGRSCGISFCPSPNSSGWWWLASSVFLTSTSYYKVTHANGYYGTCPWWAVSVIMLPLTNY